MITIGVLVSGNGTNLQAILDAIDAGMLDARVAVVVSNKADVPALERASRAGVPAIVVPHREFPTRDAFDAELVKVLQGHDVEWVVLAGFMRIVTATLLDAFKWRVVNVHPALLPAFPGTSGVAQAIAYGVRYSGCTVHLVDEGTDTGPILDQAVVPVHPDDDEHSLAQRIHVEEHRLLPEVLQRISTRGVEVVDVDEARPRVRFGRRSVPFRVGDR